MKELQFIIKFFGKMGYMDTFLKEQSFFACPAGYYCTIEGNDQGDEREASVISKPLTPVYKETCVYDIKKGLGYPIFCCYGIDKKDVENDYIIDIDKQCISTFMGDNGCAVLITYEDFCEAINTCREAMDHKDVEYYNFITFEMEKDFLFSKCKYKPLFFKQNRYSYQKEHRIIFENWFNYELERVEKEGKFYDIKRYRKEAFRKYKYEHIFTPVGIYYKNDFEEYDDGKYRIKIGTDESDKYSEDKLKARKEMLGLVGNENAFV